MLVMDHETQVHRAIELFRLEVALGMVPEQQKLERCQEHALVTAGVAASSAGQGQAPSRAGDSRVDIRVQRTQGL